MVKVVGITNKTLDVVEETVCGLDGFVLTRFLHGIDLFQNSEQIKLTQIDQKVASFVEVTEGAWTEDDLCARCLSVQRKEQQVSGSLEVVKNFPVSLLGLCRFQTVTGIRFSFTRF